MDGLAQQMVTQGNAGQQMPTVEEVIQLLLQGVDPQELLDKRVPEELLMQALQIIEQQMQSQPQQQPQQAQMPQQQFGNEPGLAQTIAG